MLHQKIYLITYGSGKYNNTKYRLKQEAINSGFFDEIFIYGYEDIDSSFLQKYKNLFDNKIEGGMKGAGFWIYKFYFLEKILKIIEENDIVFWIDAGCTINKNGKKRLDEYINILNNSKHCNLSFIMNHLPEKHWTTSQIFNYFDISMNSDIANSGQLVGGIIGMKKNNSSFNLINLLFKTIDYDYKLITNAYNKIDQNEYFKDNRHDQSIFSILRKLYGTEILNDETCRCDYRNKPFLASRIVI
tara:strand:- start:9113 stop:9847 length:735 start_codon:yes stop_codon:yes gene_type:complete